MKHVFVVNPCAGKQDCGDFIASAADVAEIDAELYGTTEPRDATRFVRQWLAEHPDDKVRFYACGGDGTLNEVVTGVVESGESARVELGCYPCGSGNDFVKSLGDEHPSIEALCSASSIAVDVIRIQTLTVNQGSGESSSGVYYSINTLNFGFEAAVCRTMGKVRRWPLIGGGLAYTTGIVHSLLRERRHRCKVTVDGNLWYEGELMLLSLANGQWAGGGFHCAPRADFSDGMIEVMGIVPLAVPRFAGLIKYYKNGELLDREELRGITHYTRGRCVTIEAGYNDVIAADGEVFYGTRFDIECLHNAVNFIKP